MTPSFYKFRHDTIKAWMKAERPYLIYNRGRIRYSNYWLDYERALMDFNIDWFLHRGSRGYYKRMRRINPVRSLVKLPARWVEICFGTTPYGKLVASLLKPPST